MAKPMWTGAPPKKNFHPPKYTGKLSENTAKKPRWQMNAYRNSAINKNSHSQSWMVDLDEWRKKVRDHDKEIDPTGMSIAEMKKICETPKNKENRNNQYQNDKNDEKLNDRVRGVILTL